MVRSVSYRYFVAIFCLSNCYVCIIHHCHFAQFSCRGSRGVLVVQKISCTWYQGTRVLVLVPGTGIGIDSVLVLVPGSTWYHDTRYQGSYSDSRRLPGTWYRYLVHASPLRCMKQLAYLIPALHREFPYQEEPSFTTTSTSIRIWYTEQCGYLFRILWWSARYQVV